MITLYSCGPGGHDGRFLGESSLFALPEIRTVAGLKGRELVGYIRALLSAIDWIYDPANRDEAARILAANVKVGEAVARSSVEGMTRGQSALQRNGEMDLHGLRNVIMLYARSPEAALQPGGGWSRNCSV